MEVYLTSFAALQVAGAILMRRHIHTMKANRARNGAALREWIRRGDVYFTMDVPRFGR